MIQLPELYSKHLKKQFSYPQYLILLILINLLQNLHTVRLEELARRCPVPIQLRSRIKKLQRFLSLEQFNIKTLWFPILSNWITTEWKIGEVIYLVIDRSQWRAINLLMVSIVYDNRAIPVYFSLLPKKGIRVTKTKGFSGFNLAAKWKSAPPALRFPQRIGRSKKKLSEKRK